MMYSEEYLPEGSLIHSEENRALTFSEDTLIGALAEKRIIEGIAILCDTNHNLTISFGEQTGIIPHSETALGVDDGKVREIAIISRVGKPVSCVVTEIKNDGLILLSRRLAQQRALDYIFNNYSAGDVIPATVTHLEPFGVFVDIGCGNVSLIGIEALSISRIAHPGDRFSVGDKIFVVISGFDREKQRVFLSHRELLGSWEENAEKFSAGQTVRGTIRGIEGYGIFVELAPNLSGLAEPYEGLSVGDSVSVFIKSIIPQKMKIKLVIIDKLKSVPQNKIKLSDYFITSGHIDSWCYSPSCSEKQKAFTIF